MPKKVPHFKSDEEAEAFLEQDLSDLDFSQFVPVKFELRRKDKQVNLRMPAGLLDAVKEKAEKAGMSYQRYIRLAIEKSLNNSTSETRI